jgi:methyltransferase (TIGR00027 family)
VRKTAAQGSTSIAHVSDTAFWVAALRAREGRRANPAFDDPLSALLSGDRGRDIARSMPNAAMVEWGTIIRTSAIDRLIVDAVNAGIDSVLNLGAGLDTRPYRMKLPPTLRWLELDFHHIVDLKNSTLSHLEPACRLERIGMDLLHRPSRQEVFARYGAGPNNTLVIAEGVIPYLSVHDTAILARDLAAVPSMRFWIQDFDNAGERRLPRGWSRRLKAAPVLFVARDWFEFFRQYGWRAFRVITSFEESDRINRPYPCDFPRGMLMRALPKDMRQRILSLSGAALMEKIGTS